jgi:hypothetical protein
MSGEDVGGDQNVDEDLVMITTFWEHWGTGGTEHVENRKMRNQSVDDDATEMNQDVSVSVTQVAAKVCGSVL